MSFEICMCPNCGQVEWEDVRQVERDECCVYACRRCDATVNVYADMDAYLYDDDD